MKSENKKKLWMNMVFAVMSIILMTAGFAIGFLYANEDISGNMLQDGIKIINKKNNANFSCSCVSSTPVMTSFTFDESGFGDAYFWNG